MQWYGVLCYGMVWCGMVEVLCLAALGVMVLDGVVGWWGMVWYGVVGHVDVWCAM